MDPSITETKLVESETALCDFLSSLNPSLYELVDIKMTSSVFYDSRGGLNTFHFFLVIYRKKAQGSF